MNSERIVNESIDNIDKRNKKVPIIKMVQYDPKRYKKYMKIPFMDSILKKHLN